MSHNEQYIRFDWAMKRLLRNKANFGILEGFLTTLLGRVIRIQKLLESESNQFDKYDKQNRVDILAEEENGDLILIEVQNNTEYAYFQRMLFGVSKLVTEYINQGDSYSKIRKVYSVNIVYFSLGEGDDTVYRGRTEFRGIHKNDLLNLTRYQRQKFKVSDVSELFPEYYILNVKNFNDVATTPLEEWIEYLKTGKIAYNASAPGLEQVREHLRLDRMSHEERNAYFRLIDDRKILDESILHSREEGREEGRAEGRMEGFLEGERKMQCEIVCNMKRMGMCAEDISKITGVSVDEIAQMENN